MDEPAKVRPPLVLFKTVEYLRECIADLDRITESAPFKNKKPNFNDVYSFVRDRFKSITQDFGIIDRIDNQLQIMVIVAIDNNKL
jgi:SAC3/GANP family